MSGACGDSKHVKNLIQPPMDADKVDSKVLMQRT